MTFPFSINTSIPSENDDPAADQPIMMTNYANIAGFLAVDHIPQGTNQSNNKAAFHKQITFSKQNPGDYFPAGAPTDPGSIAFTAQASNVSFPANTASSPQITQVQPFFWNANAPYLLNAVKAFGVLTLGSTTLLSSIPNAWNLNTLATADGTTFTIKTATNCVTGSTVSVFLFPNQQTPGNNKYFISSWTFANPTLTFTLVTGLSGATTIKMSVLILQV